MFDDAKTLDEIRLARSFTQVELSKAMGMTQAAVSKLEFRNDSFISSVRRFIEALGGHMEIRAVFPDQSFKVRGLDGDDNLNTLRKLVSTHCKLEPAPLFGARPWNRFFITR